MRTQVYCRRHSTGTSAGAFLSLELMTGHHWVVVLMKVTWTAVCPVAPALSVTRQRHKAVQVLFSFGTLRDQIVELEVGLLT